VGDVEDIAALVHAYAALLDSGELDAVAALFERATYRTSATDVVRTGASEVRPVYDAVLLYDGVPRTKHVISNLDIEITGDRASSRCYFTVLQATDSLALQPILAGRYHDELARGADGWYFTDRLILADLRGDLRRHYAS
jgi:3-phenylpropionate/cinnamic acid dioxygenase small subunit